MNILFYTPLNTRCRDIESQAAAFKRMGHNIYLFTQGVSGPLHDNFKAYGYVVEARDFASKFTSIRTLGRIFHLFSHCFRNNIDIVYSHLEPCNFVAVLTQYFVRARIIICRHHVNEAQLYPFGKDLSYKLTYRLAKEIIVVSDHAKRYMMREENVPAEKIHHINLAYDFDLYETPMVERVNVLRTSFSADIILLTVCRLIHYKRPELSVEVLKRLRREGYSVKLIILGRGELHDSLAEKIMGEGLNDYCLMPGYVNNVLDYMAAADYLVHPSLLESSCISVKEAGLVTLPVIVCRNIGDFNEVIRNGENGFLVDQENFVDDSVRIIQDHNQRRDKLSIIGNNLRKTVFELFQIDRIAPTYEELFHKKK